MYSKCTFTPDPIEKVVYILSSLESLLLRDGNEPIQQNLAERFALFSVQKSEERKKIIKTIKQIYAIRSRYLHHGRVSSELELISDFMMLVWRFYITLLENITKFDTREKFLNAIDEIKYR